MQLNTLSSKKFRIYNSDFLVIFLLVIKLSLIAVFFPEFEMPDEGSHFQHIVENDTRSVYFLYMTPLYKMISKSIMQNGQSLLQSLKWDTNFTYASNSLVWIHQQFNSPLIILLKFVNISVIIFFICLIYHILRRNKKLKENEKTFIFRLILLFFSWPCVSFALSTITSDFLTYLYVPVFFILLIYYKKFLTLFFINLIIYRYIDNNAIPLMFMTFAYSILFFLFNPEKKELRIVNRLKIILIILVLLIGYVFLINSGFIGNLFPSIKPHIIYNYHFKYEPLKSLGTLFLTSYYLGGSVSLLAFYFEYVIFFFLVLYLLKKLITQNGVIENKFYLFFMSGFFTFNMIILTIPTIDQARYYFFFIAAFIACFDYYIFKDKLLMDYKYYLSTALILFLSTIVKLFAAATKAFVMN